MSPKSEPNERLEKAVAGLRESNRRAEVEHLGSRIALVRDLIGWSQTKLAKEVGVSRGAVGQWESGRTEPTGANLREIAMKTGVHHDWLATGRGYPPDAQDLRAYQQFSGHPVARGITIKVEISIRLPDNTTLSEASEKLEAIKGAAKEHGKVSGQVMIGGQKFDL